MVWKDRASRERSSDQGNACDNNGLATLRAVVNSEIGSEVLARLFARHLLEIITVCVRWFAKPEPNAGNSLILA